MTLWVDIRRAKNEIAARKFKVHQLVSLAINNGFLTRPLTCAQCGKRPERPSPRQKNRDPIEAHHEDYERPFHIKWLCFKCHGRLHSSCSDRSVRINPYLKGMKIFEPANPSIPL